MISLEVFLRIHKRAESYRERARSKNSARSRNQSDCRISRILPAHALRKNKIKVAFVGFVALPPLFFWRGGDEKS